MDNFDWYKYAVGGAASREDSFSRLNPDYATRVAQLIQAAEQELGPRALTITSAYRSPELQAQLFEAAVKKYGSEAAARKWVAPPGRSKHNVGLAVDFADASGSMLRDPNSREAQWIAANAGRFGLSVPMSWEPWQVELAGSRDGSAAPAGGEYTPQGGYAMAGNALASPQMPGMQPQNALAQPTLQDFGFKNAMLDPQAFMRPRNALALNPVA
jgi:D-alanyl-D-alanine carboxypeptidase